MPDTTPEAGSLLQRDRVHARFAQAFARRAGAHAGELRRVLDDKLALLRARFAGSQEATTDVDTPRSIAVPHAAPGPLAELVDHAARQKAGSVPTTATASRASTTSKPDAGTAADPKTLQFFKRTWSRLSADQRLAQSRASLPDNAGPLNSHHLVHRSLTLMRELSPEYLERFVGYVDALQWLEQADEAAAQEAAARPAARRSMAARRG